MSKCHIGGVEVSNEEVKSLDQLFRSTDWPTYYNLLVKMEEFRIFKSVKDPSCEVEDLVKGQIGVCTIRDIRAIPHMAEKCMRIITSENNGQ